MTTGLGANSLSWQRLDELYMLGATRFNSKLRGWCSISQYLKILFSGLGAWIFRYTQFWLAISTLVGAVNERPSTITGGRQSVEKLLVSHESTNLKLTVSCVMVVTSAKRDLFFSPAPLRPEYEIKLSATQHKISKLSYSGITPTELRNGVHGHRQGLGHRIHSKPPKSVYRAGDADTVQWRFWTCNFVSHKSYPIQGSQLQTDCFVSHKC